MSLPTLDQLCALVRDQVDLRRKAVGLVVGVIGPGGRYVAAHGLVERDSNRRVAADTVFEIASVTKIFPAPGLPPQPFDFSTLEQSGRRHILT